MAVQSVKTVRAYFTTQKNVSTNLFPLNVTHNSFVSVEIEVRTLLPSYMTKTHTRAMSRIAIKCHWTLVSQYMDFEDYAKKL